MEDYFTSHSDEETMQLAQRLGQKAGAGDVVCLYGELGAGKTHFVKGFVTAFGIEPEAVTSPTFVLIHEYQGSLPIYHFDCYRLEKIEQVLEIGAEEYLYGEGVCIIEWPEKMSAILPAGAIHVNIDITGKNIRAMTVHFKTEE